MIYEWIRVAKSPHIASLGHTSHEGRPPDGFDPSQRVVSRGIPAFGNDGM